MRCVAARTRPEPTSTSPSTDGAQPRAGRGDGIFTRSRSLDLDPFFLARGSARAHLFETCDILAVVTGTRAAGYFVTVVHLCRWWTAYTGRSKKLKS